MTQYDTKKLEPALNNNPKLTNKELYVIVGAETESEKAYVRKYRLRYLKRLTEPIKNIQKITPDVVEKLIIQLLNKGITEKRVEMAVNYLTKLNQKDEKNIEINMEKFLEEYEI